MSQRLTLARPITQPDEPSLTRMLAGDVTKGRVSLAVFVALLAHGALVGLALQQEPTLSRAVAVTEVELFKAPPPPPPEPVEPKLEPSTPAAQPRAERRVAPAKARPAATPQPASAAPLRTVEENAPADDEPVRFVTDPNGSAFGYGTVARGGTALAGARSAALPVEPVVAAAKQSGQPQLSRPPMLGESDPCRGFFPTRAQVDRGEVALKVRVESDGKVRGVTVARESPVGQGFGFAARDCLLSKRFSPALDRSGQAVSVLSPVTVRFSR